LQEIGWTHMRVLEGVGTQVQLGGLISRLAIKPEAFAI
jgi:replication factor C subunit 2/4